MTRTVTVTPESAKRLLDTLQRIDWIAELQELDGSWHVIAGPGRLRDVNRDLRKWRRAAASTWASNQETRVRLPR